MNVSGFILTATQDRSACHMCAGDSELTKVIRRVRSEYMESPGLSLTLQQVSRLWQLDVETRDAVLQALVAAGFLRLTKNGMFVRADIER